MALPAWHRLDGERALSWVCLLIGLVQVWIVFAPEPLLIVWPDSIHHMGPAVDAVERGEFTYWAASGGFVYPLMLWGLLSIAPEPWIIIVAQRLLVTATFAALAVTIWYLHRRLGAQRWIPSRFAWSIAAFWLLVYVLYPPVIGLAQTVMPETLFALLVSLTLACLVFVAMPDLTATRKALCAAAATFLSVTLVFVKPHWLFCAIGLPIVLPFLASRDARRSVATAVLVAVALASVLVVLPEAQWQRKYDASFGRVFGPRTLFCNNGDLVQRYLATRTDAFDRQIASALGELLTPDARAIADAAGWELMGFNGDRCTYGDTTRLVSDRFSGRPSAEIGYYVTVYLTALAAEPTYLPARLGRQLGSLAAKPFNAVSGGNFLIADSETLRRNRTVRPLFARWLVQHAGTFDGEVVLPTRGALVVLRVFFAVAGLVLTVTTLLAVVVVVRRAWLRQHVPTDTAFVIVASCWLAVNGLIAAVHILEPRYLVIQTPLFALMGYLSSVTVLQR